MITKENLKDVLKLLDFTQNGNIFSKVFTNIDAYLKVDFSKNELIYPTDKGFVVNGEFTCNFISAENFVVFECIHRLFEKGYKPEHIELEPKWQLGHGPSGGRADILIRNYENNPFIIIECKTPGREFEKAWNDTRLDGGQLFSYIEQEKSLEYVALYASSYDQNSNCISLNQHIISHIDNEELLLNDPDLRGFKHATNVKERFNIWKTLYDLESTENGIFEDNIAAYTVGKLNYSLEDLYVIKKEEDIQKKYNEFAIILRQHNISGRENAFDKLVNLFLAKVVDEKKNPTNLGFRWKGIAKDDYFSFVDRLQELYAKGVFEYLKEEVTIVKKDEIYDAFEYFKHDPCETRKRVMEKFKKQKYYTNNDFSFIDVHNEKLFYQNMIVLRKIVQMIENIQLNGEQQTQFLGDLFEGFLDRGVKQSEGQFFTPMPIVKFVLTSLPIESLIQNNENIPKAIDYACGSGHFLTELASQMKPYILKHKPEQSHKNYYANIYGIEKEYRLSKVAKVSSFMYSQDDIKILYGDALGEREEIKNETFQLLVANPPFAVKGFLETLTEKERESYELTNKVSDVIKNNQIQCFFLERAKQLLAPNGMAGIIVPTSILSNGDEVHTATREIILQSFDVVALVEFGSKTFGETGTNTVVLFLRKKNTNIESHKHFKQRIESWFSETDANKQTIFEDIHFIEKYCGHQKFDVVEYKKLLIATDNIIELNELFNHDIFVSYLKEFEKSSKKMKENYEKQRIKLETDLLSKYKKDTFEQKIKLTDLELKNKVNVSTAMVELLKKQELEWNKKLIAEIQTIEKDKLYYFVMAYLNPQKVLVVKSPADNNAQKLFLGYNWSKSKGNEGIKYMASGAENINLDDLADEDARILQNIFQKRHINTPLFDNNDTQNTIKINYLIQQNFLGKQVEISEYLQPFVMQTALINLLDFTQKGFDKTISLTPKKATQLMSKWTMKPLGEVCEVYIGGTPSRNNPDYFTGNNLWVSISEMKGQTITDTKEKITKEGVKNSNVKLIPKGTTLLSFKLSIGKTAIAGVDLYTNEAIAGLIPNNQNLVTDAYLFHLFDSRLIDLSTSNNAIGQSLNSTYLKESLKIPIPPKDVQQQIVDACVAIDKSLEKAHSEIENTKKNIEKLLIQTETFSIIKRIEDICNVVSGGTPKTAIQKYWNGDINWLRSEVCQNHYVNTSQVSEKISKLGLENSSAKLLNPNTILIALVGATLGKVGYLTFKAATNQNIAGLNCINEKVLLPKYLYYRLMKDFEKNFGHSKGKFTMANLTTIKNIQIPVPPIEIQEKLVSEIEKLEQNITIEQAKIDNSSNKKTEIFKNYL